MKWLLVSLTLYMAEAMAGSYHFASINRLAEQEVGRIVLPQLYQKLDIAITITPLPGRRAEFDTVAGKLDGEIMRIFSYGEDNPTLVRVPTPYYYLETMAFVLESRNMQIRHRDDLRPLSIAKVRGVKHTNDMTTNMDDVHDFDSTKKILRLVAEGYIDVALTSKLNGLKTLERLGIDSIIPAGKALDRLALYHYIHQKHRDLVPRIDTVIARSRASGELQAMIASAEKRIIQQGSAKPSP